MKTLNPESSAVSSYLNILQGIVSRMASNSSQCKAWCVTLVSAILVVVANKSKPDYALIALFPVVSFCILDAYYLALERIFREIYSQFVKSLHAGTASLEDTFVVAPEGGDDRVFWSTCAALTSFSVLPFYALLLIMVVVARFCVL